MTFSLYRTKTFGILAERYASVPAPVTDSQAEEQAAHLASVVREAVEVGLRKAEPVQPASAPPLLDVRGVAARLAVSVRSVETLVAEGELVPVRIRNARRFTPESVDQYIRRSTKANGRL